MILSFFDGRKLDLCIEDASAFLNVTKDEISTFALKLIDNPNFVSIKSKDGSSLFPPYSLISQGTNTNFHRFNPEWFNYTKIDLRCKRHLTPSTITLMVSNICRTNCIYCYEDKSKIRNCEIPLARIKQLIHEARKLHVRTFDVIGGEYFIYKNWEEVLRELKKFGYDPYLSTKIPVGEETVRKLAAMKIRDLQISLDSLIESHLCSSIKASKGYVSEMKRTLELLNKYGIPTMIHTVLSKYNNTIQDLSSIFDEIRQMENITEWKIVKAENSIYARTKYENFKIDSQSLVKIKDFLNSVKPECAFNVLMPWGYPDNITKQNVPISFFDRNFCSGNYSSIYILPNGDVTICEQLYWNTHFIIGNVNKDSIEDIWNSKKAISLFHIKQEKIPADSKCSICKDFDRCRSLKQVCYRDIIRKYGADKWYYPDINCPYSIS